MAPTTPRDGDGPSPDVLRMGERIRARREDLGLTGVDLALQVKISSSYLSLIETKGRIPSEAVAARLADALDDDPDLYLAWSRLRNVDDLDEHVRRMTRLQEFATDPHARRRMESGAELEFHDVDEEQDEDAPPLDLPDVDDHVVSMRDDTRRRRRRRDREDDDLPTTLGKIFRDHYGDEDVDADERRPGSPRSSREGLGSIRERIRRRRERDRRDGDGAEIRPFPRLDAPPVAREEPSEYDADAAIAHGAPLLPPVGPETVAVPVLRDGDDPADDPEPLQVLTVDARLLPPDVDRPFAYRPDLRAVHRVRDLIRPGDLVVLTRDPARFHGRRIHAVRFRGRVLLTRAARKGDMLALLPPPGQPAGFEVLRLRDTTTAGRGEALAEVVAGTVVATLRWWGSRAGAAGSPSTPRGDADGRDRTPPDRPHVRPRSRTRARFADDGALEIRCDWHDRYGWRVVHNRADLEAVLRAGREAAAAGKDPGAAGRVRFVLLLDGEPRHVVEMTGTQWRDALGEAVTRPGWKRLGQAILSMTKTLQGEPTGEFLERWAPFVRDA